LLPLTLLLFFCRKPTVASWDVDLVLPVVNSQLNIKNFLGDSIFKSDQSGLLKLSITRTITAIKLDSLIKLPDTTIVNSFTVPAFVPQQLNPGQALTFFPPSELNFNIGGGAAIKRVDIRNGFLTVKFNNTVDQPLDLLYVIPSAVKNGQPLRIFETVYPTVPPAAYSLIKSYNLAGYSLNMRGLNGSSYNTIVQTYTVSSNPSANTTSVYFGQGAKTELSYANIVPEYIEGYFGQQSISIPLDTTKLNLLSNIEASNFMLSEASLGFKILNEFGAEFTAGLSNVKSINGPAIVPLSTSLLSNININRATKAANTVYPSVHTISLTSANSNILAFLSNLPENLTYQGSVNVNPLGNISGYNDFAFYNTGIKVLADINIPFKFQGDYFKLVSNTKIDFANVAQLDKVNFGKFVVSASNGYPFTAMLQAYLLDDQNVIIDSLFTPGANYIEKGQINNQNLVIRSNQSNLEIPLNKEKIKHLKKSKSIQLVSYFIMPPNPPDIKIYEGYVFDIKIRAELNYRAERK
jgi:hypothetical protein